MTRLYTCHFCGHTAPLAAFTTRPLAAVRVGGHTEVGTAYICREVLACQARRQTQRQRSDNGTLGESGV